MPGHLERHARSRWEWGTPPSRRDELARAIDDDPAGKSPGKKDPARCRGNRGGPHVPEIRLHHESPQDEFRSRCRWESRWDRREKRCVAGWHCEHESRCAKCGLVFGSRVGRDRCPAFPGTPEQRAEAERAAAAWNERRANAPLRRKPVITGPQGFRRKRGQAS